MIKFKYSNEFLEIYIFSFVSSLFFVSSSSFFMTPTREHYVLIEINDYEWMKNVIYKYTNIIISENEYKKKEIHK